MRTAKGMLLLMVLGLFLAAMAGSAAAQAISPGAGVDQAWTDESLPRLAQLIQSEQIPVDQTKRVLAALTPEQLDRVVELLGELEGVPVEETRGFLKQQRSISGIAPCSNGVDYIL